MSDILNYENFAAQANTKFVLLDASEPFALELFEVTKPVITKQQKYFSLFFRGGAAFMLPQGTYRLNHDALGETLLFLVPTAREADGSYIYEAAFNILTEAN